MAKIDRIEFSGALGNRLAGILEQPEAKPWAHAVYAHCFTCTKDIKAAYHVSRALANQGVAVLRFDFTGLGDSAGDFASSSFSTNIEDLLAAAAHLRQHHQAPQLLVGHSLGGTAALATAARVSEVRAVVTIASPFDPTHIQRHLPAPCDDCGPPQEAEIEVAGRRYRLGRQFLDDLERHDMAASIRRLGRALLVCHSPADKVVHPDQAARIFQTARHPKSFLSLDRADHVLSRREDAAYVGQLIAAWARRYV